MSTYSMDSADCRNDYDRRAARELESLDAADIQANGTTLVGQCNISHPAPPVEPPHLVRSNSRATGSRPPPTKRRPVHVARRDSRTFDTAPTPTPESITPPLEFETTDGTLDDGEDAIGTGNIMYTKGMKEVPLEARVERLFYINLYGQVSSFKCVHEAYIPGDLPAPA